MVVQGFQMSRTPVKHQVQVNFRMPEDLRDRIKWAADFNNRSMNAEIVAALEEKFPHYTYEGEDMLIRLAELSQLRGAELTEGVRMLNSMLAASTLPVEVLEHDGTVELVLKASATKP
jgi:hypothetical protein